MPDRVLVTIRHNGNIPIINRRGPIVNWTEVPKAAADRLISMGFDVKVKEPMARPPALPRPPPPAREPASPPLMEAVTSAEPADEASGAAPADEASGAAPADEVPEAASAPEAPPKPTKAVTTIIIPKKDVDGKKKKKRK